MHAGGANTVLRNNRLLLKKRPDRFRRKRTVMGLKEKDIHKIQTDNQRLTTLSASEMKQIGRKYRRARRLEALIFSMIITAVIAFLLLMLLNMNAQETALAKQETIAWIEKESAKSPGDSYFSFGKDFYRDGQYKRAKRMFKNALEEDPNHCKAADWLMITQDKINNKVRIVLRDGNRLN